MPGDGDIAFDAGAAMEQYARSSSGVARASGNMPEGSSNLNNPALSERLGDGDQKLRDRLGTAEDNLKKGKDGTDALDEKNKENAGRFKRDKPPRPLSPSSPGGGGSPSGGMPLSSPSTQMPQMTPSQPQPPMPQIPMGPTTTLSKGQLAELLNGAGISQQDLDSVRNHRPVRDKGKDGLTIKGVEIKKTGLGVLSKSQLHSVIDKALDNNGVTRDPGIRAKWHDMLTFQAQHESSFNPDAALPLNTPVAQDQNNVGPVLSDGHRAQASRGLWQTIPSTFAANHVSGTSRNIYDPVANGSAAVKYIMGKYHVEPGGGPNFAKFSAGRHAGGYTGY